MNENQNLTIEIKEKYGEECLADMCNDGVCGERRKPQGYVEIYENTIDGDKRLVGKSNLVVYLGREWLASAAFRTENASITPSSTDYICWFGVGSGGAPAGDPLNPTSPTNLDTDLDTSVMINASDATCADYRVSPVAGYYKHPFDSVSFEQDESNSDKYLITRIITTIGLDDANGYNISECGLFAASTDSGGHNGPCSLFARVTFPTLVKSSTRQLVFVWYLYF